MSAQLEFGRIDKVSDKVRDKVPDMNGKPVVMVPAKTVLNLDSGFKHKLLCDGPTFSMGTSCGFSCTFCYVEDLVRKLRAIPMYAGVEGKHAEIVMRRQDGLRILREQLTDRHGAPKYKDPQDRRVIYASPLVDVAANIVLLEETIEACKIILELTNWQIRLLSKSNLLPRIAEALETWSRTCLTGRTCLTDSDDKVSRLTDYGDGVFAPSPRERVIYGVSTGTLDDRLAKSFEQGTAPVSKRLASLHWLQDNGFRTFGMICPSLPQRDYGKFAREMASAIRADRCEHVWAEVMNLRGESFTRTVEALRAGGYHCHAVNLRCVSENKQAWERYARGTFEAHAGVLPKGKLRFLQYVTAESRPWWQAMAPRGAVLL